MNTEQAQQDVDASGQFNSDGRSEQYLTFILMPYICWWL